MELTVSFFGVLKEDVGAKQHTLTIDHDALTLHELVVLLKKQFPVLEAKLATIAYAVNDNFAQLDCVLTDGDQIALLPPVSGG